MIDNYKVLAVTLARGGSKGIFRKNITPLQGRPLIEYTILEARLSKYIDKHIVSTESKEIAEVVKNLGTEVHARPTELASDTTTSAEALIELVEKDIYSKYDFVVELMATSPLKTAEDIDSCIELLARAQYQTVVSMTTSPVHPSRIKYKDHNQILPFFPEVPESRRQGLLPLAFIRNGAIYGMPRKFLLENRVRLSPDAYGYIMPPERSINIDSNLDLLLAEAILNDRDNC